MILAAGYDIIVQYSQAASIVSARADACYLPWYSLFNSVITFHIKVTRNTLATIYISGFICDCDILK